MSIQGSLNSIIGGAERSIGIMKYFIGQEQDNVDKYVEGVDSDVAEAKKGLKAAKADYDAYKATPAGYRYKGNFVSKDAYVKGKGSAADEIAAQGKAAADLAQKRLAIEKQKSGSIFSQVTLANNIRKEKIAELNTKTEKANEMKETANALKEQNDKIMKQYGGTK